MNQVDVICQINEEPQWLGSYESFVQEVLSKLKIKGWEFSITLCYDDYIKEYNGLYRQKDEPTDVLSFCQDEGEEWDFGAPSEFKNVGDIIISLETLKRHTLLFDVSLEEELKRVTIHGILHLMGEDHSTNSADEPMLQKQERVLQDLKEIKVF